VQRTMLFVEKKLKKETKVQRTVKFILIQQINLHIPVLCTFYLLLTVIFLQISCGAAA
jgi:hypothetical protein